MMDEKNKEILDLNVIKQTLNLLGSHASLMWPELLTEFGQNADELLEEAHQGLIQGNTESVRRATHTLKSVSLQFGAHLLAQKAHQIELQAQQGNLDNVSLMLDECRAELKDAKHALDKFELP